MTQNYFLISWVTVEGEILQGVSLVRANTLEDAAQLVIAGQTGEGFSLPSPCELSIDPDASMQIPNYLIDVIGTHEGEPEVLATVGG